MIDILRISLCFTTFLIIHFAEVSYSVSLISKDGKARGADLMGLWIALAVVTGLLSLIFWYFLRPQGDLSPCKRCKKEFFKTMDKCPFCGMERGPRENVKVSRGSGTAEEEVWTVRDRKNEKKNEEKKVRDADHVWVHTSPTGTELKDPTIKPKKRFKGANKCPMCGRETYKWEKRCTRCGQTIER